MKGEGVSNVPPLDQKDQSRDGYSVAVGVEFPPSPRHRMTRCPPGRPTALICKRRRLLEGSASALPGRRGWSTKPHSNRALPPLPLRTICSRNQKPFPRIRIPDFRTLGKTSHINRRRTGRVRTEDESGLVFHGITNRQFLNRRRQGLHRFVDRSRAQSRVVRRNPNDFARIRIPNLRILGKPSHINVPAIGRIGTVDISRFAFNRHPIRNRVGLRLVEPIRGVYRYRTAERSGEKEGEGRKFHRVERKWLASDSDVPSIDLLETPSTFSAHEVEPKSRGFPTNRFRGGPAGGRGGSERFQIPNPFI